MNNEIALVNWSKDKGDETLLINYPLDENSVVLDVGGYLGDWSTNLLRRLRPNIPRVFIFEPVEDFYIRLKRRFSGLQQVTAINAALSNKTDTAKIVVNGDGSYISDAGDEIKTLDVVDFFEQYKIDQVDLMSVNIEGHEYALIRRIIGSGLIGRINRLQVQFHDSYPNANNLRSEIREKLALTHREIYCYPFVWEYWGIK